MAEKQFMDYCSITSRVVNQPEDVEIYLSPDSKSRQDDSFVKVLSSKVEKDLVNLLVE